MITYLSKLLFNAKIERNNTTEVEIDFVSDFNQHQKNQQKLLRMKFETSQ